MNYIGRTSSLHFLIGNELHRNGEVHGGSMNHFFIFVFIFSLLFLIIHNFSISNSPTDFKLGVSISLQRMCVI